MTTHTVVEARASADSLTLRRPAVVGYPDHKGIQVERVTYPTSDLAP